LVFAMEPGPQLYQMPAAGGAPRRLALNLGTYAAEPDWSRTDRNKIACTVRVGRQYQIGVFDLAKGAGKVASKASFDGVEPSWLADGRHLVYTARDRTSSVLCVLDTETGNSTRLGTPDAAALQACVWTP
jgi:TolB protein